MTTPQFKGWPTGQTLRNDLTPLLFLEHYAVANRPVVLLEA